MQKKHYSSKSENLSDQKQVSRYYSDCKELPLYNFLKVLTEEDYSYLIISGNPEIQDLQDAWEIIYNQYSDLYKDRQKSYVFEIVKEIAVLNMNLNLAQSLIDFLAVNPNEQLEEILRSMGFIYNFDHENEDSYKKDLLRVVSKSKGMLIKLESSKNELTKVRSKNGAGETNYDSVLVTLGKYQGYRIDPKTTPVSEYVEVFNQYNKMVEDSQHNAQIPG